MVAAPLPESEYEYGAIPFDLFALDYWDHSSPPEGDERQWNDLVEKYLRLPERDRFHWHRQGGGDNLLRPHLAPEDIGRVLRPRQTPQERLISASVCPPCNNFVWLRTCYDPTLQAEYDDLFSASGIDYAMGDDWVLDNAALYGFGSDRAEIVKGIVRRIPSLCDVYWASVVEDYDLFLEGEEASGRDELEEASLRVRSAVCVVDEGAIREQMVKVFWLGAHGECLWHNEVEPGEIEGM